VRRIINSTYLTLDGAVENPHLWPSPGDSAGQADAVQTELLLTCDAVLMGRKTYDSFAAVWPTQRGDRFADRINEMQKYVVSSTLEHPAWNNTTVIQGDVVGQIKRLKDQSGMNIVQYGLGQVSFSLLEHGLLDELRLWIYPMILGREGPATPHFRDCRLAQFRLVETRGLPNGVTIHRYQVP
jgi:dihydrofolate reductase